MSCIKRSYWKYIKLIIDVPGEKYNSHKYQVNRFRNMDIATFQKCLIDLESIRVRYVCSDELVDMFPVQMLQTQHIDKTIIHFQTLVASLICSWYRYKQNGDDTSYMAALDIFTTNLMLSPFWKDRVRNKIHYNCHAD